MIRSDQACVDEDRSYIECFSIVSIDLQKQPINATETNDEEYELDGECDNGDGAHRLGGLARSCRRYENQNRIFDLPRSEWVGFYYRLLA